MGIKSYTRDPVSGKWTVLEGVDLSKQQLYMAEIDPLSSFRFKTKEEPRLIGKEKVEVESAGFWKQKQMWRVSICRPGGRILPTASGSIGGNMCC